MINFLMFGGFFLIFLGLPASIITTIVFKVKKKKALAPAICIPVSIMFGLIFIVIGSSLYSNTDEYKKSVEERKQSELEQLKEKSEEQKKHIKELEEKLENAEKEKEIVESSIEEEMPQSTVEEETIEPIETRKQEIIETEAPTLDSTPAQEPQYDFEYKKMSVKYLKHEVMVDSIDQTVLVVYYEFTNNSGENKTFDYSFSDACFQNGVEVERSWWHANEESKNSGKEIKTGTTITVASSFVLGDNRDDIELEITPLFRDKVLFEMNLELEEE